MFRRALKKLSPGRFDLVSGDCVPKLNEESERRVAAALAKTSVPGVSAVDTPLGLNTDELLVFLSRDPESIERFRIRDEKLKARVQADLLAQKPILKDLRKVGYDVSDVWQFVSTRDDYLEALPVLVKHFSMGGYPDGVMDALGRGLAVKESLPWWDTIERVYYETDNDRIQQASAVALCAAATRAELPELLRIFNEPEHADRGPRILFIDSILRLMSRADAYRFLWEIKTTQLVTKRLDIALNAVNNLKAGSSRDRPFCHALE